MAMKETSHQNLVLPTQQQLLVNLNREVLFTEIFSVDLKLVVCQLLPKDSIGQYVKMSSVSFHWDR